MNDNDLITRREVELALLEKGQKTERYKWGEQWELNFSEIREALSEYQSEIIRCEDCIHWDKGHTEECDNLDSVCFHNGWCKPDWFCPDGERR